jgi:aerobic carbon-monoxide dehydrogenase small subunit
MAESMRITATVNGTERQAEVDPRATLVDVVREGFGLAAAHVGCRTGDCGACTVELDGDIVKSCLVLGARAEGASIRTVEGMADDGKLSPLQQAFWDEYGFQCGYCIPGMLFAAEQLLAESPSPTEDDIRRAISGNLCRCTGYHGIVRAITAAAEQLRADPA